VKHVIEVDAKKLLSLSIGFVSRSVLQSLTILGVDPGR
jgi:hypothetical protein